MSIKKTNEQYIQEVFDLVGDEYTVKSKYIGANKKVKFKHNICGNEFETKASHFLNTGTRCPKCSRKKRSHDDFVNLIYSLVGAEYTVLGNYSTSSTPILMRHNVCNYEWNVLPTNFTKKTNFTRCPKCSGTLSYTTSSFKEKAYTIHGDEYSVLGEFKTLKDKISVMHNTCGRVYDVQAGSFIRGAKCIKCRKGNGNKKKSTEDFKKDVFDKTGGEFLVLGDYIRNNVAIEMLHKTCGSKFMKTPNTMLSKGFICPECKKNKSRSENDFILDLKKVHGDEYLLDGPYVNQNTKVRIKHVVCNNTFDVAAASILKGTKCPYCYGALSWNTEKVQKTMYEMYGDEYELLSEYINDSTHLLIKHTNCGNVNKVRWSNFVRGSKCLHCFGSPLKNTDDFCIEVEKLVGTEYSVLGSYVSSSEPILMRHKKCNTEYMVRPNSFLRGARCPKCMQTSRGEERISRYLDSVNITYKSQFKLDDCRNQKPLPFDFAIFKGTHLIGLIEYQGEQHYRVVPHFKGELGFQKRRHNDKIKKDFCNNNNIPLLEIPYWSYDSIESLLSEFLKRYY